MVVSLSFVTSWCVVSLIVTLSSGEMYRLPSDGILIILFLDLFSVTFFMWPFFM